MCDIVVRVGFIVVEFVPMNKAKVIAILTPSIRALMSQGKSDSDVESTLVLDGWPIGAVREAMTQA